MSTSQGVPTSPTSVRNKKPLVISDPPRFDLELYIANYRGRTRYDRLFLIGLSSTFLGVDALKFAVKEAKSGMDIKRYVDAYTNLALIGPHEPEATRDLAWIERTEKQNIAETARLEGELRGYKTNLIKESIRIGNEDLGKHYLANGELNKAAEAFNRMRQDVTVNKHLIDVSRHLIEIGVEQKNWVIVNSNVQKIRGLMGSPDIDEDTSLQPLCCTAEGLSFMDNKDFLSAATSFLQTHAGMGTGCNTIITPNDVATYGGLCALATMDRSDLQAKVLENTNFRTYLELEPHIRRAVSFFVNSRYSACLAILEAYRTDYLLEIHLHKHIEDIYQLIRSKSIVQYFIPFSCVTLDSLNEAFGIPGKTIDKELAAMIAAKELDARIDTQNRLLTSTHSALRAVLQTSTLNTAKTYEREARRRIQHMNICGADLDIKSGKNKLPLMESYIVSSDDNPAGGSRPIHSGRGSDILSSMEY